MLRKLSSLGSIRGPLAFQLVPHPFFCTGAVKTHDSDSQQLAANRRNSQQIVTKSEQNRNKFERNLRKSTTIYKILRKHTKFYENVRKSTKMYKILWTCTKMYEHVQKSTKWCENRRKSTKSCEILRKCTKIYEIIQKNIRSRRKSYKIVAQTPDSYVDNLIVSNSSSRHYTMCD